MSLLKRVWFHLWHRSHSLLDKLETVKFRCEVVIRELDNQIKAATDTLTALTTERNISFIRLNEEKIKLKKFEQLLLNFSQLPNKEEELQECNEEINVLEELILIEQSSYESFSSEVELLTKEISQLQRNKRNVETQLRLALARYNSAKSQEKTLKGSPIFASIEQEIQNINDTVTKAVAHTSAIKEVKANTIPSAQRLTQLANCSTISVEDRLQAIREKRALTVSNTQGSITNV